MKALWAVCILAISLPAAGGDISWNKKAAAAYLDGRADWWMGSKTASRDHETFCISCHTALPYAVARPALRKPLAETALSAQERKFQENVEKRVRMWKEVEPWYSDEKNGAPKSAESRGTEAILDAVVLASLGSSETARALDNMWELQEKTGENKGSWIWLNFHNAPWESDDSRYYGAVLGAIATGMAPQSYRSQPAVQENLKLLKGYLAEHREQQSLINRVILLWAAKSLPGLLDKTQRDAIVAEALSKQGEDGGWNLTALVGKWKRHDNTPLETKSDGYATGLIVFALEQAGLGYSDVQLKRGIVWLVRNQTEPGNWLAYSLNKQREPSAVAFHFMDDAATAYAVLALTQ